MNEYKRLERDKRNGWSEYRNLNLSPEERCEGALMVIACHFERSVNANPEGHISFGQYVSSWLSVNSAFISRCERKIIERIPTIELFTFRGWFVVLFTMMALNGLIKKPS